MNVHGWIAERNRKANVEEANSDYVNTVLLGWIARENPENRATGGLERRIVTGELELRASKKGSGPGELVGYAAKYNTLSVDLGGFLETLAPGCFDDCMDDDCRCLRNHNDDNLLGRTKSGTLTLSLNTIGLKCECDLPDTQTGRDTAEMIRRGDMTGMSFQFQLPPMQAGEKWDWDGATPMRTITRVARLYDVAPVTNPAYPSTSVDMRSFHAAIEARKAFEAEIVRRSLFLAKARLRLAEASF